MRALYVAASGMAAQQTRIDNVANNLANVNTTGFKKARASFQDLFYQELTYGGRSASAGRVEVGGGVALGRLEKDHIAGSVVQTGDRMHVAIGGAHANNRFLRLETPDGQYVYTRDGAFALDGDAVVHANTGYQLPGGVSVPDDAVVSISKDGTIVAERPDDPRPITLGRLEVVEFSNARGLRSIGGNLFQETAASGQGQELRDSPDLVTGALEGSNVDAAEELISMIMAQRAYELNSKVVQAADETMQQTANLRR